MNYESVSEQMIAVVREAGNLISNLSSVSEVSSKEGSFNFVTGYDSLVQKFLVEKLSKLVPEAAFVCEEDSCSSHTASEGIAFIIDPIDGTTNLICGFMASAICVGLSKDGSMMIGIVYNPFRNELFHAIRGKGSFLNDRRLSLENRSLSQGILNIDTAPYNTELRSRAFEIARTLSYHTMDIRSIGSAALSICYIACGRSVAYYSLRLCTWDYAAASLILEEAGGICVNGNWKAPSLETHIPIYCGTPNTIREMHGLLE